MTSRSKNAVRSYETEIEKCREESNWKKAVELAQQLKSRSPQHESLAHFLIGEGKLEGHLDEWPPIKENIERAQRELSEARGYLTLATDTAGKKAGVALDAHLLLGKLNYACGAYDDALKNYKMAELDTLTEKELPIRSLRIVAESYAIKGLCLEQTHSGSTSKYKQAEREADMVRSFEVSSELTLLFLQRTTAPAVRAGPTLEAALQRAPLLHLRHSRPARAIERYREMLRAVECQWTQALRLTLARQLAEALLRGVHGQAYTPLTVRPRPADGTSSLTRRDDGGDGPWKPKKYTSINQFVPANAFEEILLVLVVGEAMAARDAVLSQSGEFAAAREHALRNAAALADLLAPRAARWRHLPLLAESLERAMKFSFGCAHIWRMRALCSAAMSRRRPRALAGGAAPAPRAPNAAKRAKHVMSRAKLLSPNDAPLRLVGANTCYNMGEITDGIALAEEALAIEEQKGGPLVARACLYTGIGYQLQAQRTDCRLEKESVNASCMKLLVRAVQLDNNDHLAFYHLALQHARMGQLNEAMEAARSCLCACASHLGGLRLVSALWARGAPGPRQARALHAARLARAHHPRAPLALHALAAAAQPALGEVALATGKELLALLNSPDSDSDDSESDSESGEAATAREGSLAARAHSDALSDASAAPRLKRRHDKAAAWLLLADLCLRLGRVSAAAGCVSEAAALTPASHLVFYTRGLVHESAKEWQEARECYRSAVAICPTHLDSLVHLGSAYYETGWVRLGEGALRAAAALAPARADTWRRLALVLAARGDHHAAADAAAAAVQLQPASPSRLHDLHL